MRELTVLEINDVSGAGWIQNQLAAIGGKLGASVWATASDMLNVELPVVGSVNLATLSPELGKNIGTSIGSSIGGTIENMLGNIPLFGGLVKKLLGN